MPAFDPVRDAVLNSPQTTSKALASPQTPNPATRRPTDLAALLNADPSPRTSTIAHLLRTDDDDRLAAAPSIRKPLKYSPRSRVSAPDSILKPMSQAEMNMYKVYLGKGTARLAKRKRSPSEEPDLEQPPAKKIAGDVAVVVDHCASPFCCFKRV